MKHLNKRQEKKQEIEQAITPVGSLGLLAVGDLGLRAWRKVKQHALKHGNESQ